MKNFVSLKYLLLGSASAMAVLTAVPAVAQGSTATAARNEQPIETVVITGRRAALESALKIKENAEQIVDSVVADDAGKLPDNSITEVLQRVPGVTITHFGSPSDPDHPSVEGSGLAVRGMTQINSTLNGRESFSANGGRSLMWEDVPPELMAAVNVFKSGTADQIEGGVGGSVDLRTHMPFDFDGFTAKGSFGLNFGDFVKQSRPNGSAMISNRWQTSIGEIGLLVDVAGSDISSQDDAIQVEPFYPHGGIMNTDWSTIPSTVWIPAGVDYRRQFFDRKRAGLYEALQWRPTENLELYQTAFVSYYQTKGVTNEFMDAGGNGMTLTYSTQTWSIPAFVLDKGNNVVQADALFNQYFRWWNPLTCQTNYCSLATADTRGDRGNMRTTDLTEGFNWDVNDALKVKGAFQYVHSTYGTDNNTIFATVMVPYFSLDLRGRYPVTNMSDTALTNAANYNWAATMDDHARNSGTEIAFNTDVEYAVDGGFWKNVRAGFRGAIRKESDRDTGYNYQELSAWYKYGSIQYLSDANKGDVSLQTFQNYFKGAAFLPSSILFPSSGLALSYDSNVKLHQEYSWSANDGYTPRTMDSHTLSYGETKSGSAYLEGDFGKPDVLGMAMSGNVGLRVVYNHNFSSGYLRQISSNTTANPTNYSVYLVSGGTQYYPQTQYVYREGGRDTWTALPSINVQLLPTDNTHIRLALSESMGQLPFSDMKAGGDMSFKTIDNVIYGYQVSTGQPDLKPQLSRNADLAFEWYGTGGDQAHVSLFYKSIKNYITYGLTTGTFGFDIGSAGVLNKTAQVNNYFNAKKETVIRGYEVGFTKFASFLPSPFDGLGLDANFTYIDSRAPGDAAYDMFGNLITGLPVDLLSRYNYNVVAMYEMKPFSIRAAWNWRSRYLLTPSSISGNFAAADNSVTCVANNYAAGGTGANPKDGQCYYSLPVFSKSYGQLDAGVQYEFNDHFNISFDGQNLLNSITKTEMGYGAQTHNRSWFVTDRRYSATLRFSY